MWQKHSFSEEQKTEIMLNISKKLFTAWNDAGLLYCHWKSNEHLLPGLNGETDLDVLLSKDDKVMGENILRALDFLKCKSQYGSRYPSVDDWIGFDQITGSLIHLHLHFELVTGHKGMKEYSLPWSELALRSRMMNEDTGVYIMEPNLEMVTLYTRIGLKVDFKDVIRCHTRKFKFPENVQREIVWLKERVDMHKVRQMLDTYYINKAETVFNIMLNERIEAGDYLKLRKITEFVFKKTRRIKSFIRLREFWHYVYQKYIQRLILKFKPIIVKKVPITGKGLTISFLGQDGAGKTTVTNDILKWLSWKLDAKYFYLGCGENYFSIGKKLLNVLPHGGIFKPLRAVIALNDTIKQSKRTNRLLKQGERLSSKGSIVIFDRFPQTQYAGINDGPKIRTEFLPYMKGILKPICVDLAKKEEKRIASAASHEPDLVFKLVLPPEESIRRKPKESFEAVLRKHEIIKTLQFKTSVVNVVDATMPYDKEIVLIKNIIWQQIQKS